MTLIELKEKIAFIEEQLKEVYNIEDIDRFQLAKYDVSKTPIDIDLFIVDDLGFLSIVVEVV